MGARTGGQRGAVAAARARATQPVVDWRTRRGWSRRWRSAGSGERVYAADRRIQRPEVLVTALVDTHVRSLMADHLTDVPSSDHHTVKPWFAGKVPFAPNVPELQTQGFPLIGGRVEFVAGHTAAALVYGRGLHKINLFIWPAIAPATAARPRDVRGLLARALDRSRSQLLGGHGRGGVGARCVRASYRASSQ